MEEDEKMRDHIKTAHRNMLRDAVYFLYAADRTREAQQWFSYLGEKYPDKLLLEGQTNSFPRNVTLEDYCIAKVQEDVGETSRDRIKSAIEGMLFRAYRRLVFDEEDRAANLQLLAQRTYASYMSQIKGSEMRIGLPPKPPGVPRPRPPWPRMSWILSLWRRPFHRMAVPLSKALRAKTI